jgi:hypothetical protein
VLVDHKFSQRKRERKVATQRTRWTPSFGLSPSPMHLPELSGLCLVGNGDCGAVTWTWRELINKGETLYHWQLEA